MEAILLLKLNKTVMNKENNNIAQIMDEWYLAMEENNVSVQPKVSTILGTILTKYNFTERNIPRDLWNEYLTIKGKDFESWYEGLSPMEKHELDLKKGQVKSTSSTRQLLKG